MSFFIDLFFGKETQYDKQRKKFIDRADKIDQHLSKQSIVDLKSQVSNYIQNLQQIKKNLQKSNQGSIDSNTKKTNQNKIKNINQNIKLLKQNVLQQKLLIV